MSPVESPGGSRWLNMLPVEDDLFLDNMSPLPELVNGVQVNASGIECENTESGIAGQQKQDDLSTLLVNITC